MLAVSLSDKSQCDCCGREKLTKTFRIDHYQGTIFLGYKCCARWFKINMSGNKFQALRRLEYKIKYTYTAAQLDKILTEISISENEWQNIKNKWSWL